MLCQPIRKTLANLTSGQLNDTVMFFAQLHLTLGTYHAIAIDTTNFTNANDSIDTRHIDTRLGNHHGYASSSIWGATNDLTHTSSSLHLTDAQLIRIWMFFCFYHFANCKCRQLRSRICDVFHLKAKIGQSISDFIQRCVSFKMVF